MWIIQKLMKLMGDELDVTTVYWVISASPTSSFVCRCLTVQLGGSASRNQWHWWIPRIVYSCLEISNFQKIHFTNSESFLKFTKAHFLYTYIQNIRKRGRAYASKSKQFLHFSPPAVLCSWVALLCIYVSQTDELALDQFNAITKGYHRVSFDFIAYIDRMLIENENSASVNCC